MDTVELLHPQPDTIELTRLGAFSLATHYFAGDDDADDAWLVITSDTPDYLDVAASPRFTVLHPGGPDIIADVPWTSLPDPYTALLSPNQLRVLVDAGIDPDPSTVLAITDSDLLVRPGETYPCPQVVRLVVDAVDGFDLAVAEPLLRVHPWVRRVFSDAPHPTSLEVHLRVPDELWNAWYVDPSNAEYIDEYRDDTGAAPAPRWLELFAVPAVASTLCPDPLGLDVARLP